MNKPVGQVAPFVWGALFTFAGPIMLSVGFRLLYTEIRPRWWTKRSAKIVKSEIKHESAESGTRQQFLPVVEYEYVYNGAAFRGSTNFFTIGTRESAASLLLQYQLDACVAVYVNPKNPTQSALNTRVTPASCFFLLIGALFTVIEIIWRNDLVDYFRSVSHF